MSAPVDARWIGDDIGMIDLDFRGVPRVIAAYVLRTGDSIALVECGATRSLPYLDAGLAALGVADLPLTNLLVTHIHLDHAGAAGVLQQRHADLQLWVHQIGAKHMVDPSGLLRSATRIYGDMMDTLWGEIVPCPEERTHAVDDEQVVDLGDRTLTAYYTPGHASHHIAWLDSRSGSLFTGDVAGVRIPPASLTLPPTPPPDIDISAWRSSIARMQAIQPARLLLTHFGPFDDVARHLTSLDAALGEIVALIDDAQQAGQDRDALISTLRAHVQRLVADDHVPDTERQFALTTPYGMAVDGLLRYLRKRDEGVLA